MASRPNVSFIVGDLREMILRDESMDVVVCISTLEHIGLDNTLLYTDQRRFRENSPQDFGVVLREFRRILRPGGRLLLTVPFGVAARLRWLQQFDHRGVGEIMRAFGGDVLDESYFKYEPTGWTRSSAAACVACEYFDVHAKATWDPDVAAAARAVACLELMKPGRP
jgi:ubiquinone/menaquinone biosynthesis C-methylase UbiE